MLFRSRDNKDYKNKELIYILKSIIKEFIKKIYKKLIQKYNKITALVNKL